MKSSLPPRPLKGEVSPPFRQGLLLPTWSAQRRTLTRSGKAFSLTSVSLAKVQSTPSLSKCQGKPRIAYIWRSAGPGRKPAEACEARSPTLGASEQWPTTASFPHQ